MGATNHMTNKYEIFSSSKLYSVVKQITVADRKQQLSSQSDASLTSFLPLKDAHHVPQLSTNLGSVHKLTVMLFLLILFVISASAQGR